MRERVYFPAELPCGCRVLFGPTFDNGIDQPVREGCKHSYTWSGKWSARDRELHVGKVVCHIPVVDVLESKPVTVREASDWLARGRS